MQCGLKGVCANCFQWQIDPQTGQRTKAVFACSWNYQPIDLVDTGHYCDREQMQHWMSRAFATTASGEGAIR